MDNLTEMQVACPATIGDKRAVKLNGWLLTEGRVPTQPPQLMAAFCEKLRAAGLPLDRASIHLPQNHPQFGGYAVVWDAEKGVVLDRRIGHQTLFTDKYFNSPVALMHRTGNTVRRRLDMGEGEFPVLEELAADGITDYLLMPLAGTETSPRPPGYSIATRRPGGFTPDEVSLANAIRPALGAVVEIMLNRSMMRSLLGAYVGREAARHILDGEVAVGSGETIDAVILFADLRRFTHLSETLPRDQVLTLLNDFFDVMVGAVLKRGGEVRKFIGDGLLAVFPLARPDDPPRPVVQDDLLDVPEPSAEEDEVVARALMAAMDAQAALDVSNDGRLAIGLPALEAGIALHMGTVLFGNIGTNERLDFTVIGPAVNLAARLQQLTAKLHRPILLSDRIASRSPVKLHHEGRYLLRGLAQPQEVYTPVDFTID